MELAYSHRALQLSPDRPSRVTEEKGAWQSGKVHCVLEPEVLLSGLALPLTNCIALGSHENSLSLFPRLETKTKLAHLPPSVCCRGIKRANEDKEP